MTTAIASHPPLSPSHLAHASTAGRAFSIEGAVERLATELAATAVERDRQGGHAARERELIRDSGLLALSIAREHGGLGADWATVYRAVRRLAQVDSALAHLFAFHHLQLAGLTLYGNGTQRARHLQETAQQRLFWGNALNPLDKNVLATEVPGGYLIGGTKSFSSGSVGSDRLTISAWHEPTQSALIAVLPTRRQGVQVRADWDAFGQRQTDSGTVLFDQVLVAHEDVLLAPGVATTPQNTLRSQVAQLVLVNLYLGIAQGAFAEARRYTREQSRAWIASGVQAATDDPFIQHRYGELHLLVRPAEVLADAAVVLLDQAWLKGGSLTAAERGAVALAVAEAKVLAHRAALEVGSQLFELTGARATSARHGLDRFWRNARVHTLHDPIDYKLRDLGRHALTGQVPDPTSYS